MRVLNEPRSCVIRSYTLPDLFASKVFAAHFRKWKHRIKGRDWYSAGYALDRMREHIGALKASNFANRSSIVRSCAFVSGA